MRTIENITGDFSLVGNYIMVALLLLACLTGLCGVLNVLRSRPIWRRQTSLLILAVNIVFVAGFLWICWFYY